MLIGNKNVADHATAKLRIIFGAQAFFAMAGCFTVGIVDGWKAEYDAAHK